MEKGTVKQLILDNNEDFLYLEVYNKPSSSIDTGYTELLIQTKDFIYMIPFAESLIPVFTIKDLIRTFKSNGNIEHIVLSFHYKILLKF